MNTRPSSVMNARSGTASRRRLDVSLFRSYDRLSSVDSRPAPFGLSLVVSMWLFGCASSNPPGSEVGAAQYETALVQL